MQRVGVPLSLRASPRQRRPDLSRPCLGTPTPCLPCGQGPPPRPCSALPPGSPPRLCTAARIPTPPPDLLTHESNSFRAQADAQVGGALACGCKELLSRVRRRNGQGRGGFSASGAQRPPRQPHCTARRASCRSPRKLPHAAQAAALHRGRAALTPTRLSDRRAGVAGRTSALGRHTHPTLAVHASFVRAAQRPRHCAAGVSSAPAR